MSENSTPSTLLGSLPPGTQLHEYRIERVLGHGGFGITYLARDINLDKRVAIKEFLPNDIAMRQPDQTVTVRSQDSQEAFKWGLESFIKEARVLGKFSHPSLIPVHRFFEGNNTAYFVMEFAEGVTLASVLKREGPLDEARLRGILGPILNGLEEVHARNVLHRDIKPDNIILRDGSIPVLIDFGAARQNLTSMTRSIMSVLTAGYAPIEQYATGGNQGPWTDLYALGAVAYRAISGQKPTDAINRIRNDPLVPAVKLGAGKYSKELLETIDWALAVEPEDRPSSVAEVRAALEGKQAPKSHPPRQHTGPTISAMGGTLPPEIASPEANTVVTTRQSMAELQAAAASPAGGKPWLPWVGVGAALAAVAAATVYFGMRGTSAPTAEPASMESLPIAAPPLEKAPPPAIASTETPPASSPSPTVAPSEPPPTQPAPAMAEAPKPTAQAPAPAPIEQPRPQPEVAKPAEPVPAPAPVAKPAVAAPKNAVAQMAPQSTFSDCAACPSMVVLASGTFQMGATAADNGNAWEGPSHPVTIGKPFAIAKYEVTTTQWQACVDGKGCSTVTPGPATGDPGKVPAVNLIWPDANAYTAWLTNTTGRRYRLPTEAEWEYAIRANTTGARYWGGDRTKQCGYGNGADQSALKSDPKLPAVECDDGHAVLAPVGSLQPNAWGLFDLAGNAWEWTRDCWKEGYAGAPADGSALESGSCDKRVIRGGSWRARPNSLRSFGRGNSTPGSRGDDLGLRVVAE